MKMTLDLAESIVDGFRASNEQIFAHGLVHGIDVVLHEGEYAIRLCVEYSEEIKFEEYSRIIEVPKLFQYQGELGSIQLQVFFEEVDRPKLLFSPGGRARLKRASSGGTGGWNFYLNNMPVVLTNWHVLCDQGNSTQLGQRVELEERDIASLYAFLHVMPDRPNQWDFALARLDSEAELSAFMRQCQTNCPPGDNCPIPIDPLPQQIIGEVTVGMRCKKVGKADPICRYGNVQGFGTRFVDYSRDYGQSYSNVEFRNQIILSCVADGGDSGSVLFTYGAGNNLAVGLLFAGTDQYTLANPLQRFPFIYNGSKQVPGTNWTVPWFSGPGIRGQELKIEVEVGRTESI